MDNDIDSNINNTNIHHQHHHPIIYHAPGIQINSHTPVRSDKIFDILLGQQGVLISSCGMHLRCRISPPDIAINRIISGNRCLKERRRREGGRRQGTSEINIPTTTARSIHPVTYPKEAARRGDTSAGANIEEMTPPWSIQYRQPTDSRAYTRGSMRVFYGCCVDEEEPYADINHTRQLLL